MAVATYKFRKKKRGYSLHIVFLLFFLCLFFFTGMQIWTMVGLAYTFFITVDFLRKLGNTIPIPEIMLLIGAFQWILGPWIDYITPETHYLFYMYVPEDTYMAYAVPCVLAMQLGISIFNQSVSLPELEAKVRKISCQFPSLSYWLIAVGFMSTVVGKFLPASLGFVFYLFSNIRYIGIMYLLFSNSRYKWPVFGGVMFLTFILSIAAGMFHDLLLWLIFFFSFVAKSLNLSFFRKIIFFVLGIFFVITIQNIKGSLRDVVWYGQHADKGGVALFFQLAEDEWSSGTMFSPGSINELNVRLNQGWIISRIMYNVPEYVPYGEGETIIEALNAALVPRFLAPNKPIAGGKAVFEEYTQHELGNASMGVSLAGEGYLNFGTWGGIAFVFAWGVFVGLVWKLLINLSFTYSTIMIWSPLVFQQVVKAESDLLDVLNHLVKTFILLLIILYMMKKVLRISI